MRLSRWWYIATLLLLLPALLLHLGTVTFIDDEGIRALVALEMIWSGNFVVPTLHGAFYYNKPPLWNWILAASFTLLQRTDEWAARLPTVVALLGYTYTIFHYLRREFDLPRGFLYAFIFLTCGRILFWDSMLALIDISFSWAMFGLFIVVYYRVERRDWWGLFFWSYTLMAVGFLLKGLPAIVFQGLTLMAYLIYRREFRQLFRLPHLVGGTWSLVLIGAYYWVYHQYNDLAVVAETLFTESSKRTVVRYGIEETLWQLVQFPLEMTYHFLPWSVFGIYLLHRKSWTAIWSHPFIAFCALAFAVNIWLYWSSPEVYPRYLLMHAPLYFIVGLYLHFLHQQQRTLLYRTLRGLFGLVITLLPIGLLVPIFLSYTRDMPGVVPVSIGLAVATAGCTYAYWNRGRNEIPALIVALLLFRIGFDYFVLPLRVDEPTDARRTRVTALDAGAARQGQPFFLLDPAGPDSTIMEATTSYYLERSYGGIIPAVNDLGLVPEAAYVLFHPTAKATFEGPIVDSVYLRHARAFFYIGKRSGPNSGPPK